MNSNSIPPLVAGRFSRRWLLLAAAALAVLMFWTYRETVHNWILGRGTLANDAPSVELLEEYLRSAPVPEEALLAAWNNGKIVHRTFAIRQLANAGRAGGTWSPGLEVALLAGAQDPDQSVREAALSGLRARGHPALTALAAVQLKDPDPQLRLLGLEYLRSSAPEQGVPVVAPLVDDADPRVAGRAIKLIERWSGEDFDVKLSDTVEVDNPKTGLKEFRADGIVRTRAAAARARAWWSLHEPECPPVQIDVPRSASAGVRPINAGDFTLPALEGRKVRLSEFRGKVVILNFWTTWCTACLGEIPALVELRKRYDHELVILGVSLDFVPDGHGHIGGHGTAESGGAERDHEDHAGHEHDPEQHEDASPKAIRAKVARMVKKLGINYTVLLDEQNRVGGRFNGGELPTTVIVGPEGHIRRRFVGARALPVFEAMLAEVLDGGRVTAGAAGR